MNVAIDDDDRPLGPVSRPYYAATVTGSTDDDLWKQLMFDWYGLRPLRDYGWLRSAHCPRRLAAPEGTHRTGCPDICDWKERVLGGSGYPLWDHARAWRNPDNDLVITLEPYGNPFDLVEDFTHLKAALDDLGVVTAFEGRSPYGASFILFLAGAATRWGRMFHWTSTAVSFRS